MDNQEDQTAQVTVDSQSGMKSQHLNASSYRTLFFYFLAGGAFVLSIVIAYFVFQNMQTTFTPNTPADSINTNSINQQNIENISSTTSTLAIATPTINPDLRITYDAGNWSINYPASWVASEEDMEYYAQMTLVLEKSGDVTMSPHAPSIWIRSFEVFSTSGAICANEPECLKIDTLQFTINGKEYSTDIYRLRKVSKSATLTTEHYYRFQTDIDIPTKPVVTGEYDNEIYKAEIENILSSITY